MKPIGSGARQWLLTALALLSLCVANLPGRVSADLHSARSSDSLQPPGVAAAATSQPAGSSSRPPADSDSHSRAADSNSQTGEADAHRADSASSSTACLRLSSAGGVTATVETQRLGVVGQGSGARAPLGASSLLKFRPALLRVFFPPEVSLCDQGVLAGFDAGKADEEEQASCPEPSRLASRVELRCNGGAFTTVALVAARKGAEEMGDGQGSDRPPSAFLIDSLRAPSEPTSASSTSIADIAAALFSPVASKSEWTALLLSWDVGSEGIWAASGCSGVDALLQQCTVLVDGGIFMTNGAEICVNDTLPVACGSEPSDFRSGALPDSNSKRTESNAPARPPLNQVVDVAKAVYRQLATQTVLPSLQTPGTSERAQNDVEDAAQTAARQKLGTGLRHALQANDQAMPSMDTKTNSNEKGNVSWPQAPETSPADSVRTNEATTPPPDCSRHSSCSGATTKNGSHSTLEPVPRGFVEELSPAHVKLNAFLRASIEGLREVGEVNLALASGSSHLYSRVPPTRSNYPNPAPNQTRRRSNETVLLEAGVANAGRRDDIGGSAGLSMMEKPSLSPGKRLLYDQARGLQLSFVELHSKAEALLRAGVRSKEIFAIIVDLIMNMAPTIICSMIVSVLAPPLIQIVGEILACILTPILLPGSSPAKCPTTLGKKRKMRWKPNTKPCKCEAPAKDPEFAAFLERESLDASMMEAAEVQAACDRMCDAEARLGGPKFQLDGLQERSGNHGNAYGIDGFDSPADVVDSILRAYRPGPKTVTKGTGALFFEAESTSNGEKPPRTSDDEPHSFVEVEAATSVRAGAGVAGGPQAIIMMLMSQEFPPALDAILTPALHSSISHSVIANLRRELPGSTHRHLHSSLLQYLTKHLTISMARPLLDSVATGLTLQLTRLITKIAIPAITHSVAPAVSFAVTHSPKDDYYCYLCESHRVYCSFCDSSRHGSAYTAYAANYYASYYSNYYQDYYGGDGGWANAMTMEYFSASPPILP